MRFEIRCTCFIADFAGRCEGFGKSVRHSELAARWPGRLPEHAIDRDDGLVAAAPPLRSDARVRVADFMRCFDASVYRSLLIYPLARRCRRSECCRMADALSWKISS